jgi:hypothetical protein
MAGRMSKGARLRLIGSVAAAGQARAVGGVGAGGLGVEGGLGFKRVAACGHALSAVAERDEAPVPA